MTTQLGMDPGMLTEEIEILEKVFADDGQGGRVSQWNTAVNGGEWARIRPLSARERVSAQQAGAAPQYEITMRYREGMLSDARIRWTRKGVDLEFTSEPINLDERDDYIVFFAARVRD